MTEELKISKEIDEGNVPWKKRAAVEVKVPKEEIATLPKKRGRPKKVVGAGDTSITNTTPVPSSKSMIGNVEQISNPDIAATPTLEPNDEASETPETPVSTGRKRGRPPKNTPSTGRKVGRPRKNPEPESIPDDEQPNEPTLKTPVISRKGRIIRTPMSYQAPLKSTRNKVDCSGTPTGRRRRRNSCPDENEHSMQENDKQADSETPLKEVKKEGRESPEEREAKRRRVSVKVKTIKNVVCGVCKKEMLEPNFIYHKYSVHHGLARLEGQSQEFTEQEKTHELRKTLDKLKKLHCKSCSAAFTTLLGYQYHIKRCGKDATDLEEMLQECSVCGKKVMSLGAHLKTHEKRTEPKYEIKEELVVVTPDSKSKRAAAVKATTLIREFKEELAEAPPKENVKKALKFLMAPPSQKVSNSIIGAWKKQIGATSKANCRFPSCEFSSDEINKLKEHHVTCEIGAKTQSFGCLKCSFRDPERSKVVDHILKTHVTEAEFEPVESSSSEEDEGSGEDEEELEEEEGDQDKQRNRSIPHNSKFLDKAYGLPQNVLSQFKSLLNHNVIPKWLARYHKKHFTWDCSLFTKWQPMLREILKSPQDYLPTTECSIPFTRRAITSSTTVPDKSSFGRLNRFQGTIQDFTPVFFCGGPIASAAWCPMPLNASSEINGERDQYIAVSTFREEHQFRSSMISSFASNYLIQIWNCGKLPTSEPTTTVPKLELCIAHEFGRVWSLKWCPSGCYDAERLGILAAACSDGTVRCFSVPHPSSVGDNLSEPVFLEPEPCATLKLKTQEASECTCLNWDDTKGHRFIVGGFGNGTVAVWDLEAKSPLLSTSDALYPVWSFFAHASVVTAVSLDPHHGNARFVATASMDRSVKLWDRYDCAMPVCWSKRSRIADIKWRRHWPGVTVGIDDFCALFRSSTLFYDFGYTGNRQGLLPQNSVAWGIAENEFLDVVAHCTDAGEVVIYPSHFAVIESDEKKLRKQRKIIFRTDLIQTESNQILNRMQKIYAQSTKKAITGVKGEAQTTNKSYALVFNESMNGSGKHFGTKQPYLKAPGSDTMDILLPSDEPHTSIKTIAFNPNFESHSWMCVCGENGLVNLLRVETHTLNRVGEHYLSEFQK